MKMILRDVEMVVWVQGWNTLLLCWRNGFVSGMKGVEGRELYERLEGDEDWVRGVNGCRLIRRGCRGELVR